MPGSETYDVGAYEWERIHDWYKKGYIRENYASAGWAPFGAGCASAGTGALSGAAFAWLSSCVESEAGHSGLSASGSGADAKAGSSCAGCAACASAGSTGIFTG